jgi:hypothetical protein
MPSLDENRQAWARHAWKDGGDEWSVPWGCSRSLWDGTILPRIAGHVPCEHLLEIAPGHGRCTQYLLRVCRRLTGVDLVPECVRVCEGRFASDAHALFVLNDGRSLDAVEDASVDFAFSWDSLVHADDTVMQAYVLDLASKLKPGATAFLHHSTLGDHRDPVTGQLGVPNPCWRDETMTAGKLREHCRRAGLVCVSQELVPWGGENLTDCFSLLRRPGADEPERVAETRIVRNAGFPAEAATRNRIHELYGCPDPGCGSPV